MATKTHLITQAYSDQSKKYAAWSATRIVQQFYYQNM